jgi:phosphate starvation-inducible protein PhoH
MRLADGLLAAAVACAFAFLAVPDNLTRGWYLVHRLINGDTIVQVDGDEVTDVELVSICETRGFDAQARVVILDEAQNTGPEQMKMFLTRLGYSSKAVITGDITQVDLPENKISGLVEIQGILKGIEGIEFVYFSDRDVVRHPLVQEIIKAYERMEEKRHRPKDSL